MKDTENRSLEMLRRARDFCAAHAADFAAGSKGKELFSALQAEVNRLETHAAAQTSGRNTAAQGTGSKDDARQLLSQQLKAINLTAHSLAFEIPGLDDKFRLPRGNNDQTLLNTARAFATDAAPLAAKFREYEMPATFLEDLNAAIAGFEQAVSRQHEGREASITSTASLGASTEQGVALVRQLEGIIRNKYRDDPATLAAWESASHIERPSRTTAAQKKPAKTKQKEEAQG